MARGMGPGFGRTSLHRLGRGGGGGAAAPFTPASIPDLVLWLTADVGFLPAQWSDQSTQGNHYVQATGGLQPSTTTLASGRAAVLFDRAANDRMTNAAFAGLGSTTPGLTVGFVGEYVDNNTTSNSTAWSLDGAAWVFYCGASATGKPSMLFGSTNQAVTATAPGAAGVVQLLGWRDASGGGTRQSSILVAGQAQVDGVAGASVALSSATPASVLGARTAAGAGISSLKIRHFYAYARTLDAGERAQLVAWNTSEA